MSMYVYTAAQLFRFEVGKSHKLCTTVQGNQIEKFFSEFFWSSLGELLLALEALCTALLATTAKASYKLLSFFVKYKIADTRGLAR